MMDRVEILRAACCIAGLDRQVCEREHEMLRKLADHAGVGQASLKAMIDRAQRDPNFYREQFRILKAEAEPTITALFCVACADGKLTTEERVILHHFAEKLGMDDQKFEAVLAAAEKKVEAEGA